MGNPAGSGDFSIGGLIWPGLSKLIEECGEVLQVGGKLIGSAGVEDHWDGTNLRYRMECEIADLTAAIAFFVQHNGLDQSVIQGRGQSKFEMFHRWHNSENDAPPIETAAYSRWLWSDFNSESASLSKSPSAGESA